MVFEWCQTPLVAILPNAHFLLVGIIIQASDRPSTCTSQMLAQAFSETTSRLSDMMFLVYATITAPRWCGHGEVRTQLRRGEFRPRKHVPASAAKQKLHSGRQPAASSSIERSEEELVGPVTESNRDHMRRHWPFNESCPRCHWIKEGDQWSQQNGRVPEGRRTPLTGEYWCMPRQPRRGGQWALGCTVCALVNESYKPGSKTTRLEAKHKRTSRFDTKWARLEVRTIPQASLLSQHARGAQHMRALALLNRQGSNEAAAEDTPSDFEGSGVFRGNVPQP